MPKMKIEVETRIVKKPGRKPLGPGLVLVPVAAKITQGCQAWIRATAKKQGIKPGEFIRKQLMAEYARAAKRGAK